MATMPRRFDGVLFDLLSALLDSWSLWNRIAGSAEAGRRWRLRYLDRTYAEGRYRDYLTLVAEAAADADLPDGAATRLEAEWDDLAPWPEAPAVLHSMAGRIPIGIVTNCSEALARRAVARIDVGWDAVIAAETSGWYKPAPAAYRAGLAALGTSPARTLFVAGSPFDVAGACAAGMRVFLHDRASIASPAVRAMAELAQDRLDAVPGFAGLGSNLKRNET